MNDIDAWHLYTDTRDRLIDLVRPLTVEQRSQMVPLTPGWTIAEVIAHVCGLNADVAGGFREGLGSAERTADQVDTRAGDSLEAVCDEWLGHAAAMREAIAEDEFFGFRLSADLIVHLHDVQHALGVPIDRHDAATISGGRTYAVRTPDRLLPLTEVSLTIELSDGGRFEPSEAEVDHSSGLRLRTTAYDFLRSVTARRSRDEVAALDRSDDPGPLLDHLSPYGPLRSTDAGV